MAFLLRAQILDLMPETGLKTTKDRYFANLNTKRWIQDDVHRETGHWEQLLLGVMLKALV